MKNIKTIKKNYREEYFIIIYQKSINNFQENSNQNLKKKFLIIPKRKK